MDFESILIEKYGYPAPLNYSKDEVEEIFNEAYKYAYERYKEDFWIQGYNEGFEDGYRACLD